jgi:hypothetical protein
MMSHRQPLNVVKLSDHGGQYVLTINAATVAMDAMRSLRHSHALPGRKTPLAPVLERLQCFNCGGCRATGTVRRETRRDG